MSSKVMELGLVCYSDASVARRLANRARLRLDRLLEVLEFVEKVKSDDDCAPESLPDISVTESL
jgi:hypothetical protein